MSELLRGIPPLLAGHVKLVVVALVLACAIGLPLAIHVSRRPRAAFAAVTAAGIVQTIPSLALLALMVPFLTFTGWLPAFGFPPAVMALTLYAMLPILRNTVTGLRGVDPDAIEAGRGMGMTPLQLLRIVELPLAAPVIAAGVRTAAVWTVGAATLATPIGQACLGNYIFAGLQTRNYAMLLVGIVFAAGLAVALDAALAQVESALAGKRKRMALLPLAKIMLATLLILDVFPRFTAETAPAVDTLVEEAAPTHIRRMRIGAKPFTEQYVLAELLRTRLEAADVTAEVVPSLGSSVIFEALAQGELDAYVEYSGTLWTNAMKRAAGPPRWQVLAEVNGWLAAQHVRSLGSLGFENSYALAVRRDTATRLGLHTLADLAQHRNLSIGGDYEFFSRAEWHSVQRTYGISFARRRSFDPSLLYDALARGEVDIISAFTSDGRITALDLVLLDDPAGALPPYDAMILLGPRVAADPHVACALSFHIPIDTMRRANAMVDRDHLSPAAAARWLAAQLAPPAACGREARR